MKVIEQKKNRHRHKTSSRPNILMAYLLLLTGLSVVCGSYADENNVDANSIVIFQQTPVQLTTYTDHNTLSTGDDFFTLMTLDYSRWELTKPVQICTLNNLGLLSTCGSNLESKSQPKIYYF